MNDVAKLHVLNVQGLWSVDSRCVRCDAARHWAPSLIGEDDKGKSYILQQPQSEEEERAMWRAAVACPTQSIRNREIKRPIDPVFPFEFTKGVFGLGYNSRNSFGAHSYLVQREEGNLMTDSPRFQKTLAKEIDDLGGIAHILLTHRDDVADADKWANRYGAKVWIHESEAEAAPYATDLIRGDEAVTIAPGVKSVFAPGHTEGSVVFHVDDRWLFTGDTLHWNHRRDELDVTPKQTWQSWEILADTMDTLSKLRVEWLFAGHGSWHHVGAERWAAEMPMLGPAMRNLGQAAWSARPGTTFGWY